MVIKKIEICNFRIFYKENVFEFVNGLNFILGWHGDGKTTFYDAFEWLFRTDGTNKMDTKFISKKRIEELLNGDSDDVRVAMSYEHKGKVKTLEKMFHFTKSFDGEISVSNYSFSLFENNGVESVTMDGMHFDKDFPSEIRKFIMFKEYGEGNILQYSTPFNLFLESFSDVKEFEAYYSFLEYATRQSEKARDNALRMEKRNCDRIKELERRMEKGKAVIEDVENEIKIRQDEAANIESQLNAIEENFEPIRLFSSINERIKNLYEKRNRIQNQIKEDYSRILLEDMWILMGFGGIANDFTSKVYSISKTRRKIESDYLIANGTKMALSYLDVNELTRQKSIPDYFKYNFIPELQEKDIILHDNISTVKNIREKVLKAIVKNERLREELSKTEERIEEELYEKKRLLAQTVNLAEEQLLANYENISKWVEQKNKAENRIDFLKRQRTQLRADLEEMQTSFNKIAEGTSAARFAKTALAFRHITEAFKNAKEEKENQCVMAIEDKANMFLYQLIPNDFNGTIRILKRNNGQSEISLMDEDNNRISSQNERLQKALVLALMLAIGELVSENFHVELPFIMDGSIACYENNYGNPIIDDVDRQMIILTSDYLKMDATEGRTVNIEPLVQKQCKVYYLKKKHPFDNKKLSTIELSVSLIK